ATPGRGFWRRKRENSVESLTSTPLGRGGGMEDNSNPIPEAGARTSPDDVPTHLSLLLDRSGSMASIRTEAVAGVNAFVAGQQIDGAEPRLTLVQFDRHHLS